MGSWNSRHFSNALFRCQITNKPYNNHLQRVVFKGFDEVYKMAYKQKCIETDTNIKEAIMNR